MKTTVEILKDYDTEIVPLNFPANWDDEGYCYLRIQAKQDHGKLLFISAQLHNYQNTSITNAAENIQDKAIDHLIKHGVIKVKHRWQSLDLFKSKSQLEKLKLFNVRDFFNNNSLWMQFYRKKEHGFDFGDLMFRTQFPVVRDHYIFTQYEEQQHAYEKLGFDFNVDKTKLENWQSLTPIMQ
ncbi:hypothetical protein [Vibrio sp. 1180_3]|uniref:hypothetical protein n=1 Tax=Vibrio sp. 1180_3 TaxID=2528832 RepID=UPI0024065B9A|nr:hypothetical protein [Vibrio sp. 1180_3]MDF9399091.1 hypothetical protein [Vibrio sp. 1180_3]